MRLPELHGCSSRGPGPSRPGSFGPGAEKRRRKSRLGLDRMGAEKRRPVSSPSPIRPAAAKQLLLL